MTLLDAINDSHLFGGFFRNPESWRSWRVFLSALFALPIEDEALYGRCTGARPLPAKPSREAFLIVGRRGGKSFVCALVGVYLAAFRTYQLSPGEKAVIMLLAADRKQARVLLRYAKAFAEGVPMIRAMIENITADSIELNNNAVLEIHTASFRSVRGYTIAACLADEIAFWRSEESANPDVEILNAIRPAMATIPNSLLLCLSTPYARSGALWSAYRRHFGKESDVLVWQAPTRVMNPLVPQSFIDSAFEEDSAAAAAEFGAEVHPDFYWWASWLNEKPRLLLELFVLFGIILVLWQRGDVEKGDWRFWFWPSSICLPTAILAILARIPERMDSIGLGYAPLLFDPHLIYWQSFQELFFAQFLLIYVLSISYRLAGPGKGIAADRRLQ